MSKIITTSNRGTTVVRGSSDLRKITCPRCKHQATSSRSSDGTEVIKCVHCGTEYKSKAM